MILNIVSDTHYLGADPTTSISYLDIYELNKTSNNLTVLLGDIVDRKNARDTVKAEEMIDALLKEFSFRYVLGNHELLMLNTLFTHNGILFIHGDEPFYGSKFLERRSKTPGAGTFERMYKKAFSKLRKVFDYKLSEKDAKLLAEVAKRNGCETIIIGHKHPRELQFKNIDGVKVFVVPRGLTILDLCDY